MPDLWSFERELHTRGVLLVAGVDEAGRGPLAGPVVGAAVILPAGFSHPDIRDSKLVPPRLREKLAALIRREAVALAVAEASPEEIDRVNILQATLRTMERAVAALGVAPDYVLVDGNRSPVLPVPGEAVVRGDRTVGCIAAASILAKVHRDGLMEAHHCRWPEYGFARNKGYGTAEHLRALERHGPCQAHRKTFRRVRP